MSHFDHIKIVYSWLGPKGPIWNTELPHILSFAHTHEWAQTSSSYYWTDDLWTRVFRYKKENFLLFPSSEINRDDTFIYPFSLAWRINFQHYFIGKSGILEYSHTPGHIIDNVRNGKGFFLIDHSVEAFVQEDQLAAIHQYFGSTHFLPMNRIIYLTGCMNAKEIYDGFLMRRKIDRKDQIMNIVSYPSSQTIFATNFHNGNHIEPQYDENRMPEKVFLCWNRRFRGHRTHLSLALDKEGIVDKSYWSMGVTDPENPDRRFEQTVDLHGNANLNLNNDDVGNFLNKLPLNIDGKDDIVEMCEDRNNEAREFYQNSLVSLVTETNYNLTEVTLTEKSFKPLKEKHPFIIVGAPGAIQSMRDLGFKTFNEFWSENYDTIQDPRVRLKEIVDICKDIASWTPEKILDFKRRVKPIVEHNHQLLSVDPTTRIAEILSKIVKDNTK
jgi:hypothetical protein